MRSSSIRQIVLVATLSIETVALASLFGAVLCAELVLYPPSSATRAILLPYEIAPLTDSACCLVADSGDMDMHLERLLRQHKRLEASLPRVLEIIRGRVLSQLVRQPAWKQKLFNDVNDGKVRILIGSTAKMGTGVNVQNRLRVLHYLSPPWYPSDVEQPHGRIIRQGNWNPEEN